MPTYDLDLLEKSKLHWDQSSGLRCVYANYFRLMGSYAAPGSSVEIGSGIGVLKTYIPTVITSDVEKTQYVDISLSAYEIEKAGTGWATIYAMDVLHHLREPLRFLASAGRAMAVGGRVVMLEPAATFGGRCFYQLFHHEPIKPRRLRPPYAFPADDAKGGFANMGMAWALFQRDREVVSPLLTQMGLRIIHCEYLSGISYPLTGGFSRRPLASSSFIRLIMRCEDKLPSFWWRIFGLRMLVVLERFTEPFEHAS